MLQACHQAGFSQVEKEAEPGLLGRPYTPWEHRTSSWVPENMGSTRWVGVSGWETGLGARRYLQQKNIC